MPLPCHGRTDSGRASILGQPLGDLPMSRMHSEKRASREISVGVMLRCSIMLHRNIAMTRCIMKINLQVRGISTETSLPQGIMPVIGAVILLTGLAVLPAPALFLAALIGATGLGVTLADLRRHGGPDVPVLPPMAER
jgi:hypothetical protein